MGSIARYETNARPSQRVLRKLKVAAEERGFLDLAAIFSTELPSELHRRPVTGERRAYSLLLGEAVKRIEDGTISPETAQRALVVLLDRDVGRQKLIEKVTKKALRANPEMFPDPEGISKLAAQIEAAIGISVLIAYPPIFEEVRQLIPTD